MTIQPRKALFLQPHYDDVALSCGATAAAWAAGGAGPAIVTVFASELVHGMVGPFAQWKHQRWGLDDPDAVHRQRRLEDERAATRLGCRIRWLGLPDAIYRGERYASDGALYGDLHPDERPLPEHLAEELMGLPEMAETRQVFVPLALGDHVDHQLVFETGRRLAARGLEVWAYEDLPYGIHSPQGLKRRLARVGDAVGHAVLQRACHESLQAKLEAIAAYESQVPVIFRFTDDYRAAIEGHARQVGGADGPAERFWPVGAADSAADHQ